MERRAAAVGRRWSTRSQEPSTGDRGTWQSGVSQDGAANMRATEMGGKPKKPEASLGKQLMNA